GEGHLHDVLVGLAGAEDAVVLPHRNPAPLPRLDHVGIGLLDQASDPGKRLAPPIAQFPDPLVDQLGRRLSVLRPALPHDAPRFPLLFCPGRAEQEPACNASRPRYGIQPGSSDACVIQRAISSSSSSSSSWMWT